jgi:HAD superfamily hydrolase (TIGR01509 family)
MSDSTTTRAFIFDCDGTLADTMPAHYRAWLEVLEPHGVPFPEDRFYALGGTPTVDIARRLFTEVGKDTDYDALSQAKERTFLARIHEVLPIAKVVDVARAARGTHPIAVASGGHRHIVELTLTQIGVREWFPVIVGAEDTARGKPEPDVFLEAARRLAVSPGVCVVYEDTDIGLEAARRAGMLGIDVRLM